MSIYEAIGLAWVVFTSAIATIGILYLAYVGLKVTVSKDTKLDLDKIPGVKM